MHTVDEAAKKALEWCKKHKGWQRICDIPDTDNLYKNWDELSPKERKPWIDDFGKLYAEDAWNAHGRKPCKVTYGFISGKGEFYKDILQIPPLHNFMMVFKTTS